MVRESACEFARRTQEFLPQSYVYLFGSQAKGSATEKSDIDMAVLCKDLSGKSTQEYLALRRRVLLTADEVDPKIEAHMISCEHEHSGFVGNILDTGVCIAEPKGSWI